MLDDPDIDALVIAVPPAVQQIIIREALQRNKHLFCEKPLGVSAEVTQAFASEAAHKKLANMVDFEFCAIPAWIDANSFLKSGALGQLKIGMLNWQVETTTNRMKLNSWKRDPEKGGGVLYNFVSHIFYNLEWLCGPIRDVMIVMDKENVSVHGILKFQCGLVFNICVGTNSYQGSGQRLELYGEQGMLQLVNNTTDVVNGFVLSTSIRNENTIKHPTQTLSVNHMDGRTTAVSVLANRFVHWIQSGELQTPNFFDGHRVNLLIQACQMSYLAEHWVSVTYNLPTVLQNKNIKNTDNKNNVAPTLQQY